jgi:hypothetical protein
MLSCINANGEAVPNFYIFKGKRMRRNFLQLANPDDTMAMQPQAWMTTFLFDTWISHFIAALNKRGGVSPTNRHVLVLNGHNSHVTLDVVRKAATVGLDIVTLPSHTSHHLQPLDVAVFRPFKYAFRKLRNAWTLCHKCRPAQKEDLCQWVCLALRKALSERNIKKDFAKTGIWPFNPSAVDGFMGLAEAFQPDVPMVKDSSSDEADEVQDDDPVMVEVVGDRIPASQEDAVQYFMCLERGRAPSSPRVVQSDTSESSDDEGCLAEGGIDREGPAVGLGDFWSCPELALLQKGRGGLRNHLSTIPKA